MNRPTLQSGLCRSVLAGDDRRVTSAEFGEQAHASMFPRRVAVAAAALALKTCLRRDDTARGDDIRAEIDAVNREFVALVVALPPPPPG